MNPGFMSAMLLLCAAILLGTGWKPLLAPSERPRVIAALFAMTALAVSNKLWLHPLANYPDLKVHIAALLLLAAGAYAVRTAGGGESRGNFALYAPLLALIWGSLRGFYGYDPIVRWLEPGWLAPALCGMLCGAFISDTRLQFGIIVWGAAGGEYIDYWLRNEHTAFALGGLLWWDGVWLAFMLAIVLALGLRRVKAVAQNGRFTHR